MTEHEMFSQIILQVQSMQSDLKGCTTEMKSLKAEVKSEMQGISLDVKGMQTNIQSLQGEQQEIKAEIQSIQTELQKLNQRVIDLELHIESETDRNIQIITENFLELSNKLTKAIPITDKNLAYEVKVNYLINEVDKIKEKLAM